MVNAPEILSPETTATSSYGCARISGDLVGASAVCSVDEALTVVSSHAAEWAAKPFLEKVGMIDALLQNYLKCFDEWMDAGLRRRGITNATPSQKFEQTASAASFALLFYWTRNLLEECTETGLQNYLAETLPDGRVRVTLQRSGVANLLITSTDELILAQPSTETAPQSAEECIWRGFHGEPWMLNHIGKDKIEFSNLDSGTEAKVVSWWSKVPSFRPYRLLGTKKKVLPPDLQPAALQASQTGLISPGVTVILGAGNSDVPSDIVGALLCQHQVVVYKVHPLMEQILPVLFRLYKPFLLAGVLRIVKGGPSEALQLLNDSRVTKWIHTGHARTAAQILFNGNPPRKDSTFVEFAERLQIKKNFCIELGGHSPCIVAPSVEWTNAELKVYARHVAFHGVLNGGHYCCKLTTIVTCKNWDHRDEFIKEVREALINSESLAHWYPGTDEKFEMVKSAIISERGTLNEAQLKDDLIFYSDVSENCKLFREELFCRAILEIALDTEPTPQAFLPAAVKFCNEKLVGNLAACIICKPGGVAQPSFADRVISESVNAKAVNDATLDLEYSCVAVNVGPASMSALPWSTWSGCPGATNCETLVSGVGYVGNIYNFRHPVKTIQKELWMADVVRVQVLAPESLEMRQKVLNSMIQYLCKARGVSSYIKLAQMSIASVFI